MDEKNIILNTKNMNELDQNTDIYFFPYFFLHICSEALELIPVELRSRGARFVDLTGSTGATSILTALWSLGWISLVTYETNYENLGK